MKLRIEPSAIVITPTIAKTSLVKAVESVEKQTYKNLQHLVVADGRDYFQKVLNLSIPVSDGSRLTITSVPFNTGGSGFYGHRILAAYPHLVDHDYVLFLDDDNWWSEDHVRTLIDLCESRNLDFTHSLRKVYVDGEFLADDCCEAIGRWPIAWTNGKDHLVDTSSYCFRRSWLIRHCQLWHNGWGADRLFFNAVKLNARYDTTGLHTLHYELPDMNKAYGGDTTIFAKYNQDMKSQHGGKYPWQRT